MNIIELEEISMRALPALETRQFDGWVLRFADGYTRRANAIYPLYSYSSTNEPSEKVNLCERFYVERSQPVFFKLTPAVHNDLDVLLQDKGYEKQALTNVQTCHINGVEPVTLEGIEFIHEDSLSEDWLVSFLDFSPQLKDHSIIIRQVLKRIVPAACFLRVMEGDEAVGVGLAVRDGEYVGLFDIISDPAKRGRGIGQAIVNNLLVWGKNNNATKAYLQVMQDNEPALRLYEKFGFEDAYQYWYRAKTQG